ncbi:MinD/ParA family ATP-binding protein [Trichothermofontia sp.]
MTRLLHQGYDVVRLQQGILDLVQRLRLDCLLIDSHPAWDEGALATMGMVDIAIVLMCLDRQDFQGTAVALDITASLEVPHTLLVVNQVLSSYDHRSIREQLMATYNIADVTLLPLSLKMALMGGQGLFCLKYPQDELTQKIEGIAQTVLALVQVEQPKFKHHPLPLSASVAPSSVKSGLRIVDLLEMPREQRQLVRWLMRRLPTRFAEIAAYAAQTW